MSIRTPEFTSSLLKKAPEQRLSLKAGIILGLSYAYTGQIPLGLGLMNQLRDDALATNDQDAAARASIHIAWVLIMKNDLENAAIKIKEALRGSPKMDLFTKRLASLLQAVISFEKKEFKKSHAQLKKTLETRDKYSFTLRGHRGKRINFRRYRRWQGNGCQGHSSPKQSKRQTIHPGQLQCFFRKSDRL